MKRMGRWVFWICVALLWVPVLLLAGEGWLFYKLRYAKLHHNNLWETHAALAPGMVAIEDLQQRADAESGAVRVTTIHKSKGLEYGVVFCPLQRVRGHENIVVRVILVVIRVAMAKIQRLIMDSNETGWNQVGTNELLLLWILGILSNQHGMKMVPSNVIHLLLTTSTLGVTSQSRSLGLCTRQAFRSGDVVSVQVEVSAVN